MNNQWKINVYRLPSRVTLPVDLVAGRWIEVDVERASLANLKRVREREMVTLSHISPFHGITLTAL